MADKHVAEKLMVRNPSRLHETAKALYHNKTDVVNKAERAPVAGSGAWVSCMKCSVCKKLHDTTRCFQLMRANSVDHLEIITKCRMSSVVW